MIISQKKAETFYWPEFDRLMYAPEILRARFEEKYIPEPNSGCWLWLDKGESRGYGYLKIAQDKMIPAHKFSYGIYKGAVPKGLVLDHLCRVRCCVNPDHLEPVTHKENILRGVGTGAKFARRTHCNKGHLFSADNLANLKENRRRCLICRRLQDKSRVRKR